MLKNAQSSCFLLVQHGCSPFLKYEAGLQEDEDDDDEAEELDLNQYGQMDTPLDVVGKHALNQAARRGIDSAQSTKLILPGKYPPPNVVLRCECLN